jgi:hypothetical protein
MLLITLAVDINTDDLLQETMLELETMKAVQT